MIRRDTYRSAACASMIAVSAAVLAAATPPALATDISDRSDRTFPDAEWASDYRSWLSTAPLILASADVSQIYVDAPPGREETKREVRVLVRMRALRAQRSAEIVRQIADESTDFERVLGFRLADAPELDDVIRTMMHDTLILVARHKKHFSRARPRHVSEAVAPLIPPPGHPAYPSGHATQAYVVAYLLAQKIPSCRAGLLRVARRIAVNREIAGVHFPSDTAAGVQLARTLVRLFTSVTKFKARIDRTALPRHHACESPS
ncbi:MAG: phosphatase PAP2 family protein [Pseudomonadota bacterium]